MSTKMAVALLCCCMSNAVIKIAAANPAYTKEMWCSVYQVFVHRDSEHPSDIFLEQQCLSPGRIHVQGAYSEQSLLLHLAQQESGVSHEPMDW